MNSQHVTKILLAIKENALFFEREDRTFVIGLILSELQAIKKYIKDKRLIQTKGKEYFLTEAGKNFIKENPVQSSKLDKYTNLEYLKSNNSNIVVSKAINLLAKHILDKQEIKKWTVEFNILHDLNETKPELTALKKDIQKYILNSGKISLKDYFIKYTSSPYHITKPILSVLLLDFISANRNNIAIYQDKEIQINLNHILFINMINCPERYSLRAVDLLDNPVLYKFSEVILPEPSTNILLITKGLITFIKSLNNYTLNTESINKKTIKFREAIKNAEDPFVLICKDIPKILVNKEINECSENLVIEFKKCVNELKYCYQKLLQEIHEFTLNVFKADSRNNLTERFFTLKDYLASKELAILYNNVTDRFAPDKLWIERICICQNKSLAPEDWNSIEVANFKVSIKNLANVFLKIEEIVFDFERCKENSKTKENIIDLLSQFSKREQIEIFKTVINK